MASARAIPHVTYQLSLSDAEAGFLLALLAHVVGDHNDIPCEFGKAVEVALLAAGASYSEDLADLFTDMVHVDSY